MSAYKLEIDEPGCQHCGGKRMWTIVGPDEVGVGTSWGDHEAASDICDLMNMAFDAGVESTRSASADSLTPLERYALAVLDAHREEIGDLDGAFLQDEAEKYGLLESVSVTEPCGELCRCAEYDDFPQECLRIKAEFMPKMSAHRKAALSTPERMVKDA